MSGFRWAFSRALGFWVPKEDEERILDLLDLEGSFLAFDGDECVGTLGAYQFDLSTPNQGPPLPAGGTTVVGVLPTHRRRGILRALMTEHLDWARERELVAVGLWASEPDIYPNFDFGLATQRGSWTLDLNHLQPAAPKAQHELRYIDIEAAKSRLPLVYEACRHQRAGALSRADNWWRRRRLNDDPTRRNGSSPYQFVVATREGQDVGYLQFRRKSVWNEGRPEDVVHVEELMGDAPARAALYHFLASMDLVKTAYVFNRPVDEPLPLSARNRRHAQYLAEDAMWLRILDVPRFLRARGPGGGRGHLFLGVREGAVVTCYEIRADDQTWSVEKTSRDAELTVALHNLPELAWAESSPALLWEADLLEGSPEAIGRAHQLFSNGRRPWCPERF